MPLQILAAGREAGESVDADVFLLTPGEPRLGRLDRGVTIERSVDASAQLLADLRSDKNSTWIPERATLTHVAISARAQDVRTGGGHARPTSRRSPGVQFHRRD